MIKKIIEKYDNTTIAQLFDAGGTAIGTVLRYTIISRLIKKYKNIEFTLIESDRRMLAYLTINGKRYIVKYKKAIPLNEIELIFSYDFIKRNSMVPELGLTTFIRRPRGIANNDIDPAILIELTKNKATYIHSFYRVSGSITLFNDRTLYSKKITTERNLHSNTKFESIEVYDNSTKFLLKNANGTILHSFDIKNKEIYNTIIALNGYDVKKIDKKLAKDVIELLSTNCLFIKTDYPLRKIGDI